MWMSHMFRLAFRELAGRRKLHVLNVVAFALVTALIVVFGALGTAYRDASQLPFKAVQNTIIVQKSGNVPEDVSGVLLSCSLAPIHQSVADEIGRIDGVRGTSSALSLWVFDPDYFKRVIGLNWNDTFGRTMVQRVIEGSIPATDREALVEETYARQYGLAVGQEIQMAGRTFTVSGIVRMAGNEMVSSDAYVDIQVAQTMAYNSAGLQATEPFGDTDINIIFVDAGQTDVATVSMQIDNILANGETAEGQTPLGQTIGAYTVYTPESFDSQISSLFRFSDKLVWLISLIAFISGALLIARNVLHSTMERRREFSTMKAVGFSGRDVRRVILAETGLTAGMGFLVGLGISAVTIAALSHTTITIAIPWELTAYPHFLLSNPGDANVVQSYLLPVRPSLVHAMAALGTAAVAGVGAALFGAWQVNRLSPMVVMKNE